MNTTLPYINIHTHKTTPDFVIGIRNLLPEEIEGLEPSMVRLRLPELLNFSCGIHPWFIKPDYQWYRQIEVLEKHITSANFRAVGEAGLDKTIATDLKLQTEVFVAQIRLSEQYRKPMIIHCVRAYNEVLMIRKQLRPAMTWIIHGYNSSLEMAHQMTAHNILLSFGKTLFKPSAKALEIFQQLSDDKYFLETDDDDTPIEVVYQKAAELRKISIERLKLLQNNNFNKVFGA